MKLRYKIHFRKNKSRYMSIVWLFLAAVSVLLIVCYAADGQVTGRRRVYHIYQSPFGFSLTILLYALFPILCVVRAYFYGSMFVARPSKKIRMHKVFLSRAIVRYNLKNYPGAILFFEKAEKIKSLDFSNKRLYQNALKQVGNGKN